MTGATWHRHDPSPRRRSPGLNPSDRRCSGANRATAYFASAQAASELHVDILMRMHKATPSAGYDALALDSSERRRARGLLELLTEAGMDVREGVDPKLVERERAIETQLNTLAASRMQLQSRTQTPEAVASLDKDITRLEQERERARNRDPEHQPSLRGARASAAARHPRHSTGPAR